MAAWRSTTEWKTSRLRRRFSVIAFGGGILVAAVALILVPEGIRVLSPGLVLLAFIVGGLTFFLVDRAIASSGWAASQLLAMLLDLVLEAIALGAVQATGDPVGLLLALLIALQNFPEGFNAYRELVARGAHSASLIYWSFSDLVLLGPPLNRQAQQRSWLALSGEARTTVGVFSSGS